MATIDFFVPVDVDDVRSIQVGLLGSSPVGQRQRVLALGWVFFHAER